MQGFLNGAQMARANQGLFRYHDGRHFTPLDNRPISTANPPLGFNDDFDFNLILFK